MHARLTLRVSYLAKLDLTGIVRSNLARTAPVTDRVWPQAANAGPGGLQPFVHKTGYSASKAVIATIRIELEYSVFLYGRLSP